MAALKCLSQTDSTDNIIILSGGTDGTDGPTDATGALADGAVLRRAAKEHLNLTEYLTNNDAWHFFDKTQSLIITGPTHTNVMNIMMVIVL